MSALLDGLAYLRDALRDEQRAELNDWLRRQPQRRPVVQRFLLVRHDHAPTVVARGEEFDNGSVALYWVGDHHVETLPDIADLRRRHCTDRRTIIRWQTPFTEGDWNGT
ncbi:MAG: hypothetical protein ACRDO7_09255 [Nocardioidaceae bacterium]